MKKTEQCKQCENLHEQLDQIVKLLKQAQNIIAGRNEEWHSEVEYVLAEINSK
ncbi:MAG TPA: hypothetical protein VJN02_12795 [Gammaproteobacteria bacterium]|nr:hypothetical protein [Gammaproteobacteria bacterium]